MNDLSLLIPAANEMFLKDTVEDAIKNIEADTDIIALLDGQWADPPIPQHPRVNLIYMNKSVGQRAGANLACKLSRAKYVMKVDAHCSFDKGFDRKMLEAFEKVEEDVTMVPIMRNLWAFDWKCMKCGKKWYQGPTPTKCKEEDFKGTGKPCTSDKFKRKMMWVGKKRPQSTSYLFDKTPHFQYFNQYIKRPEVQKMRDETRFTETMSLQGSCFMLSRKNYWKWNVCDETKGNWGNQGIEVACKTWLLGGRVLCYHDTWYAHMFRTQGGDFGFPWNVSGRAVHKTKKAIAKEIWENRLPNQKRPLRWLVERFWPVPGWEQEDLDKLPRDIPPHNP